MRVQTYSNGNLFLIENNLVVVPIKFPYKFAGIKVVNGIFYLDEKEIFYLLPVIKLLPYGIINFGYLFIPNSIYGLVGSQLKIAGIDLQNPNKSLIFMKHFRKDFLFEDWNVYLNPPINIGKGIIEDGKRACTDPYGFIRNVIRVIKKYDGSAIYSNISNMVKI